MNLIDIVTCAAVPEPWAEGEKIPWDEPGFSARMLKEHLSQAHDAASRRFEIIDRHVAWIHHHVLGGHSTRVLDLGCGPGLYSNRLARLGHTCVGFDFGPASIAYAQEEAARDGLACTFRLADIRAADYGEGYDLAMLIYGEMNVFRPVDIRTILNKAARALIPGWRATPRATELRGHRAGGKVRPSWYATSSGLFSDSPHLVLTENSWNAEQAVGTTRHIVVDADSGEVTWVAMSNQAYTNESFRDLLRESGFDDVAFYPSLTGEAAEGDELLVVTARTKGGAYL